MKIEKRKTKQQDFRMATPKMPQVLILKGSDGSIVADLEFFGENRLAIIFLFFLF